jgi:hypothetical protein
MTERKDNKRINDNYEIEVELHGYNTYLFKDKKSMVYINLINRLTGEIRQKRVTLDFIIRRVFQSEIETWKKEYNEIIVEELKE